MEPIRIDVLQPEHQQAFRSLKAAKNLILVIILLCLLVQMAAVVAIHYLHILDPIKAKAPAAAPTTQTTQAAVQALLKDGEEKSEAEAYEGILHWVLPLTKFIAFAMWLILLLVLMLTVQLSVVARTGGTAGFLSAFLWSLLLMIPLVPWQQVLHTSFASGAMFNLEEVISRMRAIKPSWGATPPTLLDKALFYVRMLGYPGVAVLMLVVVQVKFLLGYNRMECSATPEPPKPPTV